MRGKFWISSILATAVTAAGWRQSLLAQPAPSATPPMAPVAPVATDPLRQATSVLSSPRSSPDARSAAAERLISLRSDQSRQAVRDLLMESRVPLSQAAIAQALANDPDPDRDAGYIDPLFVMLSAPGTGLAAAQALGIYKIGPQHDAVLSRLRDTAMGIGAVRTSEPARRAAAISLGQMPDKSAAETLMGLLTSAGEPPEIHRVAAEALTALSGDSRIGQDAQGWTQWWASNQGKSPEQFRSDLLANQATQLNALKRRYKDLSSNSAAFVEEVYHSTPVTDPAARSARLLSILNSAEPVIRAEGARIVFDDKRYGIPLPPNATAQLQKMIGDSDPEVRLEVANALAVLNDRTALRPLLDQLAQERDPSVVAALARALGQIGDVQAIDTLLRFLDDPSTVVATAAAKAIAGLGAPLQNIPRNQARQIANKLQRVLERANNPGSEDLREATVSAMAELRDETLAPTFQKIVNDPNESPLIRQKAINGIGKLGDPKSADLIAHQLQDPDVGVRGAAVQALEAVNGTAYANKLVDMLRPGADDSTIQESAWHALQSFLPTLDNVELQSYADQFAQDAPDKRVNILMQISANQQKVKDTSAQVKTLMNIGESQMDPKVSDFQGAAATYLAAISTLGSNANPNSVDMIRLTQGRTQALLRAGQYHDAIEFARTVLARNPARAGEIGALIADEADTLARAGKLDKAQKLLGESQTLEPALTGTTRDQLKSIKDQVNQQVEKNKGSGYVVPTPIQINASSGATAKASD